MSGPVDLLFAQPPLTDSPIDLVFGATGGPVTEVEGVVAGALPGLTGSVHVATVVKAELAGAFPGLTGAASAVYVSGAARPTVNETTDAWQVADTHIAGVDQGMQTPTRAPVPVTTPWSPADRVHASRAARHSDGLRTEHAEYDTGFQAAMRVATGAVAARHGDGLRIERARYATRFSEAQRLQNTPTRVRHQDALRNRRNWAAVAWQQGAPHFARHVGSSGPAKWLNLGWLAEHQNAMRPLPGTSIVPGPLPEEPCYVPPDGDAVELVFDTTWSASPHLLFTCGAGDEEPPPDATVVIPIKRVYVVLNETSLRRVEGNIPLPTFDMSLSIDFESWTWAFSASLPGAALADLQPSAPGEPVLVEAMINGVAYRMQVERRARDRSFTSDGLKIAGRGLPATLDAPYAPTMNHTNTEARTAQQLMNDVLTLNGVSLGWTVDWQAVDWTIPAGVFAHQGSYISALNRIAEAAGSYIQPHRASQTLRVLPRYPVLPWAWSGVTPDYEIPSSVATVEGIEFIDKALYNRVFVSGVQGGVLGQVTRAGTDGTLVAPMIVDPLITTAAAARQRGTPALADTGSQATVTLRMPVLPATGVIVPGKFVRYTDGATQRVGITRGVAVDVRSPEVWQTLTVETHV